MIQKTENDGVVFAGLVETYQTQIYNLCYRMTGDAAIADEAAQEVFCQAYRQLNPKDPPRRFQTKLLAIAFRKCKSLLPLERGGESRMDLRPVEDTSKTQALFAGLEPEERAAAILHFWYELSTEEMAEVLGTNGDAAIGQLWQAKKTMAENLNQIAILE